MEYASQDEKKKKTIEILIARIIKINNNSIMPFFRWFMIQIQISKKK